MNAGSTETAHHPASPGAVYGTHFLAGAFLGLLVAVVMAILHNVSPLPALERAGADAAQRMYASAGREGPGPRVVLAGLDAAAIAEITGPQGDARFAQRLRTLLDLGAAAVLVDLEMPEDAPPGRAEALHEVLVRVAEAAPPRDPAAAVGTPAHAPAVIAAALPWHSAAEGYLVGVPKRSGRSANLVLAASLYEPDADSVVRTVRAALCRADASGHWVGLPHLAAAREGAPPAGAAPGATTPPTHAPAPLARATAAAPPCAAGTEVPILFHAGPEIMVPGSRQAGRLRYLPPGEAPTREMVQGAVVVLGAVGTAALRDRVRTPLGIMDGALVSANAALTLLDAPYVAAASAGGPAWLPWALWAFGGAVTYFVLAPVTLGWTWLGAPGARRGAAALGALAVPPLIAALILAATHHPPDYAALFAKVFAVAIAAAIFALHALADFVPRPAWLPRGLWRFVAFVLAAAAAVTAVLMFNLFLAEHLLPRGWRIASLLPAFAVMLEAVAEGLKPVSSAIHHGVERRFAPPARPGLLAPLLLIPAGLAAMQSARAAGGAAAVACPAARGSWQVEINEDGADPLQRQQTLLVARRGQGVAPIGDCAHILPGDTLLVGYGVALRLRRDGATPADDARKREGGPTILLAPPLPVLAVPSAFERFGAAVAEAVVPPALAPRLPVQAAMALPLGKKTPSPPGAP